MAELLNWLFGQYADYPTLFITLELIAVIFGVSSVYVWGQHRFTCLLVEYFGFSFWAGQYRHLCLSAVEMAIIR